MALNYLSVDPTLKLFIVGFFVGLIVALIPTPGDVDTEKSDLVPKQIFAGGVTIWKAIYFLILIITLPLAAVEPLKKRLKLSFFPFPFIVGNATSMAIVTLILTVSTLF